MSIADLRQTYERNELLETSLAGGPIEQFAKWFDEALEAEIPEPNAMTLATTTPDGRPSARIVLLKGLDERGLTFFTNYQSRKGRELDANPFASLLFFWPALERQVRFEGAISKLDPSESDSYFESRPIGSRVGAWASPQSQPITREELELRTAAFTESLGASPKRPPHWGGYRLRPDWVEFWQGRPSRLHDRLVYSKDQSGRWVTSRLAP